MARQTITTIHQQHGNLSKASGRGPTYRVAIIFPVGASSARGKLAIIFPVGAQLTCVFSDLRRYKTFLRDVPVKKIFVIPERSYRGPIDFI